MSKNKVNKRQKGRNAEKDYEKILQAKGYKTQLAQSTSVFTGKMYVSRYNDFFNLFDIIGLHRYWTLFVQVKTNVNHVYDAKKNIKEFCLELGNDRVIYHIVLKVAYKGYVIWELWKDKETKFYYNTKGEECDAFVYASDNK